MLLYRLDWTSDGRYFKGKIPLTKEDAEGKAARFNALPDNDYFWVAPLDAPEGPRKEGDSK